MSNLPYDPGPLPLKPPPNLSDVIQFEVDGYPPYKDESFSIRNPKHRDYLRFVNLRKAGIAAMDGRAWSHAPIRMDFTLYAEGVEEKRRLLDYIAGIEDSLDGSSGDTFTYLPVVFEDDCQICSMHSCIIPGGEIKYRLRFEIMENAQAALPGRQ